MDFVWVFNGEQSHLPSGVFATRENAEDWIARHRLSGILTRYPLDAGIYDWAIQRGLFQPRRDHTQTPKFIGRFTSAYLELYHYEGGREAGAA